MSKRPKQTEVAERREEVRRVGRGGACGGEAAGSCGLGAAGSSGSQAAGCRGSRSKLICRSAAHLDGRWLCFAKPKEWPRIRSLDWNKNGTKHSFLTLE